MCEKSTRYARGTVWWVETKDDSMCTTSQKGRRPFLIISNNEFNRRFGKVTVIPMSHQDKYEQYDFVISTIIDGKKCYALVDQIRQMDTSYLKSYAYTLNTALLTDIDTILVELYTNMEFEDSCEDDDSGNHIEMTNASSITDIDALNNRISELDEAIKSTHSTLNDYAQELNALLSNLNKSINSLRETGETSTSNYEKITVSETKPTKTIKASKKSKSSKTKSNKHNKSSMPYKFYSDINNNIDFWNDLLVEGETFVCSKYNLKDGAPFNRRKSRVKMCLIEHGYNVTDIIDKE